MVSLIITHVTMQSCLLYSIALKVDDIIICTAYGHSTSCHYRILTKELEEHYPGLGYYIRVPRYVQQLGGHVG